MPFVRAELLRRAATSMHDFAVLRCEQLGEEVMPEPFTRKQRVHSRLDGGEEIGGSSRTSLEVTPSEPPGHVVRERTVAEAELRACRNSYSEVPLTGCQQSASPTYRLLHRFGRTAVPDEHNLWVPRHSAPCSHSAPWDEDEECEIYGASLPDGRAASVGDVEQRTRSCARAV